MGLGQNGLADSHGCFWLLNRQGLDLVRGKDVNMVSGLDRDVDSFVESKDKEGVCRICWAPGWDKIN
jgi:hypothetical protein